MTLIETLLHHTDGMSGVTFADDEFLRRLLHHTDGMSGVLSSRIISEALSTMTDYLAAQFNTYDLNIDEDPGGAKEAYEANITLLEGLLGFEPTEELLDCAIAARDHVCIPGVNVARSGESMISAYRHVVEELNLFFGGNILQAAIDRGVELAPEFQELMDAVYPVHLNSDTTGAESGNRSVFGPEQILGTLVLLAPGGPANFTKAREKLPDDTDDDLFLVSGNGASGVPATINITLGQVAGPSSVVPIVHPNTPNLSVPIDPPNKFVSVDLMAIVAGGVAVDNFTVIRERVRSLPT